MTTQRAKKGKRTAASPAAPAPRGASRGVAPAAPTSRGASRGAPAAAPPATRGASRGASPPAQALQARLAEIQASIDVLLRTIERLDSVPPAEVARLSLDDRKARAHAQSDAFLAIEDLENAKLKTLNDAFEAKRPQLEQATVGLANDLARLQDTVAFIGAAASAIGIIADVAALIR